MTYIMESGWWKVATQKTDERHRIPLPKIARDIIEAAPEFTGPYIFTTMGGEKPFTQGGKPYGYLYGAAGPVQALAAA